MKPNLWTSASVFCLVAGALAWASPSSAQDVCFMVDGSGQRVSLEHLCQGSGGSESSPSQPETSTRVETSIVERSSRGNRRGVVTTVSPISSPSSSGSTSNNASSAFAEAFIESRRSTTRIQSLETSQGTLTVIESPDRNIGGAVIRGRDQIIITPPNSDSNANPTHPIVIPGSGSVSGGSIRINVGH